MRFSKCDSLDRLTLAYPSVSQEALRRIGTLKELTFLALPGANVNDDVVRHWCDLTSLWEVNLDDTQISVDTIGWLSRMESLRRLSINRVPLTEAAADALAELDQISELYLAGVSMSRRNLCKVLKRRNLETLDLSGWEIDDELLGILCSDGTHLKHLILRDNELDGPTMKRLLVATPHLYVDMGDFPDYIDRPSLEELHRRAGALRAEMNTGWRLMLQPRDDVYQAMSAGYIVRTGPDQNQAEGFQAAGDLHELSQPSALLSMTSRRKLRSTPASVSSADPEARGQFGAVGFEVDVADEDPSRVGALRSGFLAHVFDGGCDQ